MLRVIFVCLIALAPVMALAADPLDPQFNGGPPGMKPNVLEKPQGISFPRNLNGSAVFGQQRNDAAFGGLASGSAFVAPTGRGVVFVPAGGRGNFAVGAGGIYLGGGHYYLPPTSYYHPYWGWSRPQEMYYSDPFFPYSLRPTGFLPSLPDLPPRDYEGERPPPPPGPEAPRGSSAKEVAQVKRLIEFGDTHFQQANLVEAIRRYKTAADIAPELSAAHFRYGIALVANGQYDRAGQSFQKGMAVNPDWARERLRLDDLYGKNSQAKEKNLEELAQQGLKSPRDPLPLFLLGMMLHFNGEADRAAKFLEQAHALGRQAEPAARPGVRKAKIGGVDL